MNFKMAKTGSIDPAKEIDLDLARERLAAVARRRAESFARAMTKGLHDTAKYVGETKAVNGDVSESFRSVKEDAAHVQFAAQEEPHFQVGDRVRTEVRVGVVPELTPNGRDPEVVARAFEFGSVAMDVPVTAFSQDVEKKQQDAARNDMREVAEVLE